MKLFIVNVVSLAFFHFVHASPTFDNGPSSVTRVLKSAGITVSDNFTKTTAETQSAENANTSRVIDSVLTNVVHTSMHEMVQKLSTSLRRLFSGFGKAPTRTSATNSDTWTSLLGPDPFSGSGHKAPPGEAMHSRSLPEVGYGKDHTARGKSSTTAKKERTDFNIAEAFHDDGHHPDVGGGSVTPASTPRHSNHSEPPQRPTLKRQSTENFDGKRRNVSSENVERWIEHALISMMWRGGTQGVAAGSELHMDDFPLEPNESTTETILDPAQTDDKTTNHSGTSDQTQPTTAALEQSTGDQTTKGQSARLGRHGTTTGPYDESELTTVAMAREGVTSEEYQQSKSSHTSEELQIQPLSAERNISGHSYSNDITTTDSVQATSVKMDKATTSDEHSETAPRYSTEAIVTTSTEISTTETPPISSSTVASSTETTTISESTSRPSTVAALPSPAKFTSSEVTTTTSSPDDLSHFAHPEVPSWPGSTASPAGTSRYTVSTAAGTTTKTSITTTISNVTSVSSSVATRTPSSTAHKYLITGYPRDDEDHDGTPTHPFNSSKSAAFKRYFGIDRVHPTTAPYRYNGGTTVETFEHPTSLLVQTVLISTAAASAIFIFAIFGVFLAFYRKKRNVARGRRRRGWNDCVAPESGPAIATVQQIHSPVMAACRQVSYTGVNGQPASVLVASASLCPAETTIRHLSPAPNPNLAPGPIQMHINNTDASPFYYDSSRSDWSLLSAKDRQIDTYFSSPSVFTTPSSIAARSPTKSVIFQHPICSRGNAKY